jgi:hypothetical protein
MFVFISMEEEGMRENLRGMLCAGVLLVSGTVTSAYTATITFNFNSLADEASNSSVQSYMNNVLNSALGPGKTVTVVGAKGERNYNGENHVVGPGGSSATTSLTLGNSEGATVGGSPYTPGSTDTFITNVGGTGSPNDRITMQFAGLVIQSLAFDYEIFPNGSCPSLSNCGSGGANLPDFKLYGNGSLVVQRSGVAPGTGGTYSGSPAAGHPELAPQRLGTVTWTFTTPVSSLWFVDWPALVGVDNLSITTGISGGGAEVPEPASIILLTTAAAALYLLRRKQRA